MQNFENKLSEAFSENKFPWKAKQTFLLYTDITEFWCVKPDPNLITLSFCKEVLSFQEHTNIF